MCESQANEHLPSLVMNLEVLPSEYHTKLKLNRANIFDPESYLSKSAVFELYQKSLFQWRYHPREYDSTTSMTWGSLVDCLITTPEDFDSQFTVSPFENFKKKEAREWRDNMQAEGVDIVTEEMIEKAEAAVKVLTETHEEAAAILADSRKQVMLMSPIKHPLSDKIINMKALLDVVPNNADFIADIKTVHDFTPSGFEKAIAKYGYHVQASHYLNLWNLLNPDDQRHRFRIIWQDSNPPYEVAITELPETDIADGADLFNHLLSKIIVASKKNKWEMRFPKTILLGRATFGMYQEGQEIDGYVEAPK